MLKKIMLYGILFLSFVPAVIKSDADDAYNPKDLSDYFGSNPSCTYDRSENDCRNGNEYKFYLKMYDIKFLYKRKYNVELDTSLIMSALFYNHEEPPIVFERNLNQYDRFAVKNGTTITNLDWEYDFKNDPCYTYLNSNDFSYDMQILAKNMVKKEISYKCKSDGAVVNDAKAEDVETSNYSNQTLKCDKGEYDSDSISAIYKVDLDKYDDFLLEYTKLKYHTPGKEISSCSSNVGNNYSSSTPVPLTASGKAVIDALNEEAVKAAKSSLPRSTVTGWYGFDDEWCAMFISWLFNQIGGLDKYFVKSAGSGPGARESIARGYGTWIEDECTDPTAIPRAGDVLHFREIPVGHPYHTDMISSRHVGYVYAVDDNKIYTVEGNSWDSEHVMFREHDRKSCGVDGINGYYRPYY